LLQYRAFLVTFHSTILFPLEDFSFAMDFEVALPSGNIGDEPEACGNTLEGFSCAGPEYVEGKRLMFDEWCMEDQKERVQAFGLLEWARILGALGFA
jgi:hypothetical protein